MKIVLVRKLQHPEMHAGIFVTGETEVANLAILFRLGHGFVGAAFSEKTVRIFQPDIFMKLPALKKI